MRLTTSRFTTQLGKQAGSPRVPALVKYELFDLLPLVALRWVLVKELLYRLPRFRIST